MDIGFYLANGTTLVRPDRNLSIATKPNVFVANFGDGYEQRVYNGINNKKKEMSLVFNNRDNEEVDDIVSFLEPRVGVHSFNYTFPNSNEPSGLETIKVVCDEYSVAYINCNTSNLTMKVRQVYEL